MPPSTAMEVPFTKLARSEARKAILDGGPPELVMQMSIRLKRLMTEATKWKAAA